MEVIRLYSAGFHLAHVPCLGDSSNSVRSGLRELQGTIVIDLGYRVGTYPAWTFVFTTGVGLDHYLISRMVCMLTSSGILGFVVLEYAMLLTCFDVLPVGFKGDVKSSNASLPNANCVGVACVAV